MLHHRLEREILEDLRLLQAAYWNGEVNADTFDPEWERLQCELEDFREWAE